MNRAIIPVPIPNAIGATIPLIFPSVSVNITKSNSMISSSFGKFIFVWDLIICGENVKISKNKFVDAICQRWLLIEVMIDKIKISFMIRDR